MKVETTHNYNIFLDARFVRTPGHLHDMLTSQCEIVDSMILLCEAFTYLRSCGHVYVRKYLPSELYILVLRNGYH